MLLSLDIVFYLSIVGTQGRGIHPLPTTNKVNIMKTFNASKTINVNGQSFDISAFYSVTNEGYTTINLVAESLGETVLVITGDEFGLVVDNRLGEDSKITATKIKLYGIEQLVSLTESLIIKECNK